MTYFTTFYFCVDIFGCSSGAWDWATTCHQRTLVVAIWAAPARRKIPATSNSSTQTHFSNNWRFGSEPPCYCCVTSAFNIKRKIINLSSDFNDDPLLIFMWFDGISSAQVLIKKVNIQDVKPKSVIIFDLSCEFLCLTVHKLSENGEGQVLTSHQPQPIFMMS